MSNETKIGLLAVITIVLSFLGYNFIKGVNLLNAPKVLYADYPNVAGLTVSSPVMINGLQVGVVKDMYFKKDLQTIRVEMNVEKDFTIPKDAESVIMTTGLMGGTAVVIKYQSTCSGNTCAQNGDVIRGRVASAIESFLGQPEEMNPYFKELQVGIGPVIDTFKVRMTDPNDDDAISKSIRDIAIVLENLKATTASMNRLMAANAQPLNGTMKNAESLTKNLSDSNPQIKGIISNTDSLTAKIANLELDKTLDNTNAAIASLQTTMVAADSTLNQLTQIMAKINNGEGAIGQLMTDGELLDQFASTAIRLDSVLTDFQERPYRYVPFKSRKRVKKMDARDAATEK